MRTLAPGPGARQQETKMSIFTQLPARFESAREEEMSVQDYLDLCKRRPLGLRHRRRAYAAGHRRA